MARETRREGRESSRYEYREEGQAPPCLRRRSAPSTTLRLHRCTAECAKAFDSTEEQEKDDGDGGKAR